MTHPPPMSDEEMERAVKAAPELEECARSWQHDVRLLGNVRADDIALIARALLAFKAERDSALARAEQAEDGCANWHRIALEKQEQLAHSESERLRHLKAAQDAVERADRAEREIARLTANADHSCTCPHGDAKEPLANHDKMCPIRVNKFKRIAPEVALSRLAAALDSGDEVDELRNENTQLRADLAAAREAAERQEEFYMAGLERRAMDAERRTAEAIAAWLETPRPCGYADCESKYGEIAAGIRNGDWKERREDG